MSNAMPMPTGSDLLRSYVRGWLAGDADAVVATLADDAVVTESHGPTYLGAAEVHAWIERWVAAGDRVHRWDLIGVVDSDGGTHVAAEWDFACTVAGVDYEILGATVATVDHGRLTRITEYRREPEEP
jgi:ketosteroid isomerase-like protein